MSASISPFIHWPFPKKVESVAWAHESRSGPKCGRKRQTSVCFQLKEGALRPAQVGEPGKSGAARVAPVMRNGYLLLQPSLHLIRATAGQGRVWCYSTGASRELTRVFRLGSFSSVSAFLDSVRLCIS